MKERKTSTPLINELFDLLDDWRHLPSYQLERRADIFFALYLKEILKKKYGKAIKLVIPEFPLRVGDYDPENKHPYASYKIDYVAIAKNDKDVYLIELKTDQSYRRTKQDKYLAKAKGFNIPKVVDDIISIYGATNNRYKGKYDHLISKLVQLGWVCRKGNEIKTIAKDYSVSVVYIQPVNTANQSNVISFSEVESYLKETDLLTKRFVKSLKKWKNKPDGKSI